jgi:hypothetical protein
MEMDILLLLRRGISLKGGYWLAEPILKIETEYSQKMRYVLFRS